ncbi:hypothetical protein PspLS_00173 [Pyricularia sp. CBS 133598]|nr:hypothetical protein PspLS_00173 [Pyricularia sp. CBS 133598]
MQFSTFPQLLAVLALSATVLSVPVPISPTSTAAGHPDGPRAVAACQAPRLHAREESSEHALGSETAPTNKGPKSEKTAPKYDAELENEKQEQSRDADEEWKERAAKNFEVMKAERDKLEKEESARLQSTRS